MVKNPQPLGQEDSLRRKWQPLQYSCWEIPWTEEPGGLQSMGSDTTEHTLRKRRYKGPTGSCNWKQRGGSGFRLSTVLKTISFCQSALLPTGWLSSWAHDGSMCLLIWICFCSAFPGRTLRLTLIRALLDLVLLQHSHLICQNGSAFRSYPTSTSGCILSPSPLLSLQPTTTISPGLLESSPNWSLPASAAHPPAEAWMIL